MRVITGLGLKAIRPGRRKAELSDGSVVDAGIVLLSIGVRPELALAKAAGLAIGGSGGLEVDDELRTSDPRIYAAGDMVEVLHKVSGRKVRVPLAGPANRQGRIAASNALGMHLKYRGALGTSVFKAFDAVAASTGLSEKAAREAGFDVGAAIVFKDNHASYYPGGKELVLKLVYDRKSSRLLGAQAFGTEGVEKRIDVLATALHGEMSLDDLAELDLAYAPPFSSANDPVNVAAFVAQNDVSGFSPLETAAELKAALAAAEDGGLPPWSSTFATSASTRRAMCRDRSTCPSTSCASAWTKCRAASASTCTAARASGPISRCGSSRKTATTTCERHGRLHGDPRRRQIWRRGAWAPKERRDDRRLYFAPEADALFHPGDARDRRAAARQAARRQPDPRLVPESLLGLGHHGGPRGPRRARSAQAAAQAPESLRLLPRLLPLLHRPERQGIQGRAASATTRSSPCEGSRASTRSPASAMSERAALDYARCATSTPVAFTPEIIDALRSRFSERAVVVIASTCAQVNFWARLIQSLGVQPAGFSAECSLLELEKYRTLKSVAGISPGFSRRPGP